MQNAMYQLPVHVIDRLYKSRITIINHFYNTRHNQLGVKFVQFLVSTVESFDILGSFNISHFLWKCDLPSFVVGKCGFLRFYMGVSKMWNMELWNKQKLNSRETWPYAGSTVYLHYSPFCKNTITKVEQQ